MNIVKKVKNYLKADIRAAGVVNHNITVTRSIVHNKRIAPKGHAFMVAKGTVNKQVYTLSIMFNSQGATEAMEAELKQNLTDQLIKRISA